MVQDQNYVATSENQTHYQSLAAITSNQSIILLCMLAKLKKKLPHESHPG